MHPPYTAKYPFSCLSSHAPQDAIKGVKEVITNSPVMAGLLVSESLQNTNAQRALSSREGRGVLEDYHAGSYKKLTKQPSQGDAEPKTERSSRETGDFNFPSPS
uniref:Uncharacterized protein n=1 Tax=Populus trichocarpa TaxID=3694 RepID=A0A2K2AFZ2_POPTR